MGQVVPAGEPGPPGLSGGTWISRVIGPQPAPACWGVSVACQEPAAGALISVNQKYGGPPWRSREVAATPPSGPVSDNPPSSCVSITSQTRPGAALPGAPSRGRKPISPPPPQAWAQPLR